MPPVDGQGPIFLTATDYDLPDSLPEGIGKYTNFRDMARGGSAVLRTCFDQITGRTVVMKTLLPEFRGDEKENRRLLREARVTAQLQHPNTVPGLRDRPRRARRALLHDEAGLGREPVRDPQADRPGRRRRRSPPFRCGSGWRSWRGRPRP